MKSGTFSVAGWPDRELSLGDIDAPIEGDLRALRGLFALLLLLLLLLLLGAVVIVAGQ